MPFHDLNVAYTTNYAELSNTLAFLAELGYHFAAVAISVSGKLPAQLGEISFSNVTLPKAFELKSRLNLTISDTSQNHRLNSLTAAYDLVALRPTNEKAFQLCCSSLESDIISLDLSQRLLYPIKFKTVASALQRGIRFEICYSPGITGGNDARRNLISGAAALIRATRGRGIIVSSEAKNALGLRGPWDVINLAQVWGLTQERAKESICEEAGKVVRLAGIKRTSFRGVVDIINDGSQTTHIPSDSGLPTGEIAAEMSNSTTPTSKVAALESMDRVTVLPKDSKRKASSISPAEINAEEKPLSKREMKRRAKKARLEKGTGNVDGDTKNESTNGFPIRHEALTSKKKS